MNLIFIIICLIHIIIWNIVLLAFLNKNLAIINIYIIIPLIYILHILPFHILVSIKKNIYPNVYNDNVDKIDKFLIIPYYFGKIMKYCDDYCTFSPISPQGMLIFGLISSIYSLTFYHKKL